MVPVAGLEPARFIGNGFWIHRVYQFHHTGFEKGEAYYGDFSIPVNGFAKIILIWAK